MVKCFDPEVPWCKLGTNRNISACNSSKCDKCGWEEDEAARRKKLLEMNGLSRLSNGLLGLKI